MQPRASVAEHPSVRGWAAGVSADDSDWGRGGGTGGDDSRGIRIPPPRPRPPHPPPHGRSSRTPPKGSNCSLLPDQSTSSSPNKNCRKVTTSRKLQGRREGRRRGVMDGGEGLRSRSGRSPVASAPAPEEEEPGAPLASPGSSGLESRDADSMEKGRAGSKGGSKSAVGGFFSSMQVRSTPSPSAPAEAPPGTLKMLLTRGRHLPAARRAWRGSTPGAASAAWAWCRTRSSRR